MTTSSPTGFCSRCNQRVLLTRKDFDTCLAILLLIFTVIGFFIYLAVYYKRKEDRCTHCGTEISISQSYTFQPQNQNHSSISPNQGNFPGEIRGILPNYCSLCGEKLEAGIKFCPNCGSILTEE